MDKTIVGRIGEKAIPETIQNYQANIPEQELTAKRIFEINLLLRDIILTMLFFDTLFIN